MVSNRKGLVFLQIRLWIASIAFSLVFGTIFAKTWRVYYVFYSSNRHKRNKKVVSRLANVLFLRSLIRGMRML